MSSLTDLGLSDPLACALERGVGLFFCPPLLRANDDDVEGRNGIPGGVRAADGSGGHGQPHEEGRGARDGRSSEQVRLHPTLLAQGARLNEGALCFARGQKYFCEGVTPRAIV